MAGISPGLKRQAFLAVGFTSTSNNPELQSGAVTIANCSVSESGRLEGEPGNFSASAYLLDQDFVVRTVGYPVPRNLRSETVDLIRRYRQRFPHRPQGPAQILVRLVMKVASTSGGYVGEDLLVSILPRLAIPAQMFSVPIGREPDGEREMICMSVRREAGSEVADFYGPATICPGMATMGSELWVNRRPPWWKDAES